MTALLSETFALAHVLAPEFEEILEVSDLALRIETLDGSLVRVARLERRNFVLGDELSMAGLLLSMVSLFLQIREGNTYQGEHVDKIRERLILKLGDETSLPAKAR